MGCSPGRSNSLGQVSKLKESGINNQKAKKTQKPVRVDNQRKDELKG